MFKRLRYDIAAIQSRDPAARGFWYVFLLYPGLKAIRAHRLAGWLYSHKRYFLARWISQRAAGKTGIEIHPAAKLGRGVFIDHGSGVVIGETTVVGDNVTIYQGVTLGGTGKEHGKRHPTIGDNVMIGSGARVLGPINIGSGAKIAAGAVVLGDVPENATAVGVPARVVRVGGTKIENLDQVHIPDPVSQELCKLKMQIERLQKKLEALENDK